MAVHSMCQPGRPRPSEVSQAGSSGRSLCQSRQSSGSFLPGRSGSPPRSAKIVRMVAASTWLTEPNSGSALTEK